jgi:hypothetical protein
MLNYSYTEDQVRQIPEEESTLTPHQRFLLDVLDDILEEEYNYEKGY